MSIADELGTLQTLLSSGALTEEEFAKQKQSVLAGASSAAIAGSQSGHRTHGITTGAKVVLVLSAVPIVMLAIGFVFRYQTTNPVSFLDVLNMLGTIGPNGPNLILYAILFVSSPVYALTQFLIGIGLLVSLYYLVENERKLVGNSFAASLLSTVVYCVLAALALVLTNRRVEMVVLTSGCTLILLITIRAMLGALSRLKSRGKS
jgi:hypothetical protein